MNSRDRMEIVQADITTIHVDAIVNAANESLLGGGGVDGAIHSAAGPELLAECRAIGGCPTGEARITRGYRMPARWVIHTVGPVWQGGHSLEAELLAGCYVSSLTRAREHGIKTIAFPAVSAGVYGFPMERAARIAITVTKRFLDDGDMPEKVAFVCFSQRAEDIYQQAMAEVFAEPSP